MTFDMTSEMTYEMTTEMTSDLTSDMTSNIWHLNSICDCNLSGSQEIQQVCLEAALLFGEQRCSDNYKLRNLGRPFFSSFFSCRNFSLRRSFQGVWHLTFVQSCLELVWGASEGVPEQPCREDSLAFLIAAGDWLHDEGTFLSMAICFFHKRGQMTSWNWSETLPLSSRAAFCRTFSPF